jgi:pyruvate dehydrogenase E1 component beta subunit
MKGEVPEEDYVIPLGVGEVKREGGDVTIVAVSIMVHRALAAAEALSKEGIECEVIDPRSLLPYDGDLVNHSVMKTGRALIVHEATTNGGMGGEFAARIASGPAFDYLDAPIKRLGGKFIPIPYNPTLERATVPQEEDIIQAVRELIA